MLEEVTSNWMLGLHSIFDIAHFLPVVPSMWDKQAFNIHHANHPKIRKTDIFLGYLILFWIALYLMYEKCLNLLLRRMHIPLMQRSRIIQAVWSCGFCFGSICYLKSPSINIANFPLEKQGLTHMELGIILHKAFYFHSAGIEIFHHGVWMKGCSNLLFGLFIMNPYQEKWCYIVSTFLFYKALDTVVTNVCQLMLCFSHVTGKALCKLLFWLHCLSWVYLYVLFVPKLMLWPETTNHGRVEIGLWLWFTAECLNSVWLRLIRCAKATHWLEICLFPPPTQEAIQLAGIQRRHRDSLKKSLNKAPKKTELWQTLICAMTIKKKIKRIREAKKLKSETTNNSPEKTAGVETNETQDTNAEELENNSNNAVNE